MNRISSTITVSPAYGRDYKTAKAAKADFLAGKDFYGHFFDGIAHFKPCGVQDFVPGIDVIIRYCRDRKVTKVRVPKEVA